MYFSKLIMIVFAGRVLGQQPPLFPKPTTLVAAVTDAVAPAIVSDAPVFPKPVAVADAKAVPDAPLFQGLPPETSAGEEGTMEGAPTDMTAKTKVSLRGAGASRVRIKEVNCIRVSASWDWNEFLDVTKALVNIGCLAVTAQAGAIICEGVDAALAVATAIEYKAPASTDPDELYITAGGDKVWPSSSYVDMNTERKDGAVQKASPNAEINLGGIPRICLHERDFWKDDDLGCIPQSAFSGRRVGEYVEVVLDSEDHGSTYEVTLEFLGPVDCNQPPATGRDTWSISGANGWDDACFQVNFGTKPHSDCMVKWASGATRREGWSSTWTSGNAWDVSSVRKTPCTSRSFDSDENEGCKFFPHNGCLYD